MPDTVVTETPVVTPEVNAYAPAPNIENPATTSPVEYGDSGKEAARRALYEKHYGTSAGAPPSATSTPDSASPAQGDQISAPVVPDAVVPDAPPAYFTQALEAIRNEFASLRSQIPPTAAVPATTPVTPAIPAESPWVAKLREGDIPGAERAMAEAVAKLIKAPMTEDAINQSVQRSEERFRAMNEIDGFVRELRAANSDLMDMEQMITLDAAARLQSVQQSGSIKSTGDAVREYKKAVIDATDNARKVAQKLRGSGKNEAMVRTREVLSASTLQPQSVNTARTQGAPAEPQPETTESYFDKRKAAEAARRGLAV